MELDKLYIKVSSESILVNYYHNYNKIYKNDSGLDLIIPKEITIEPHSMATINLGIKCAPKYNHGYYLFPRSSISNTPLRLANSVGIIDCTYRGELMAKVDNISDKSYTIKAGTKLFQICMPDLKPFDFEIVDNLDETERGDKGFGSTNI